MTRSASMAGAPIPGGRILASSVLMHPPVGHALARTCATMILALVLSGCATTPEEVDTQAVGDPAGTFAARQATMGAMTDWHAAGRMAVKQADEGWSATVAYEVRGPKWRLRLSGPLGQGALQLDGLPGQVTITDSDGRTRSAESSEALLEAVTGRRLPVGGLRYWLRGVSDPARSLDVLVLGEDGLPDVLEQAGWRIEFPGWQAVGDLRMPRSVKLDGGDVSGTVAIHRWRLSAEPAN